MAKRHADFDSARGLVALWGGWGLAILAWGLHLAVGYGLVGWYCRGGRNLHPWHVSLGINLLTLICAALAGVGIALAWRNFRRAGSAGRRSRFMALCGVLMSLFFLAVILMQGLPNLVLEPCQ